MDLEAAIGEDLASWSPGAQLLTEISYSNRASRAWHAVVRGARVVVKLTFDGPPYVEPGLRVAWVVQERTGIATGRPLADSEGRFARPIETDRGTFSLSVLEFVHGTPVEDFEDGTARQAGELLATVHAALAHDAPTVPGELLTFVRGRCTDGDRVSEALTAIEASGPQTRGVLYGDPSPELLLQPSGALGLIDWGTPPHGPLLYDVAAWRGHVGRVSASATAPKAFLDEYRSRSPIDELEYQLLDTYEVLWRSAFREDPGPTGSQPTGIL